MKTIDQGFIAVEWMVDNGVSPELSGRKILVVEDETLISMLFEDVLGELGCEVVGPALNIRQATELANSAAIDAAILDVNLNNDPIFPVAEILAKRGIPMMFASGYGSTGLPQRWQDRPTLPKPFDMADIEAALRDLMGRADLPPTA